MAELSSRRDDLLAQLETRASELESSTANLEESSSALHALRARVQELEQFESDKSALQDEAVRLRQRYVIVASLFQNRCHMTRVG